MSVTKLVLSRTVNERLDFGKVEVEFITSSRNKRRTKTLYRDYLHCTANCCVALIFSIEIVLFLTTPTVEDNSSSWNTCTFEMKQIMKYLPVKAQILWTLKCISFHCVSFFFLKIRQLEKAKGTVVHLKLFGYKAFTR